MLQMAYPLRNLVGRPTRTLLTAAGVAVAVASYIALLGMSRGLENAWVQSLEERGTHLLAVRKGAIEVLTGSIEEETGGEIARSPGVAAIGAELMDLVMVEERHPVLVCGWQEGSFLWDGLILESGKKPGDAGGAAGVYLGNTAAQLLGKAQGQKVSILGRELEVVGVLRPSGALASRIIVMPLGLFQELLGRPGKVTEFNLRLRGADSPGEVEAVRARLAAEFPGLSFTATREVAEKNDVLKLMRAMAWGTSTIALVMGLFFVLNTLLMSVTERTRELGILSAVGWSRWRIMGSVVLEGMGLSLAGGIAGLVLGVFGLRWLSRQPRVQGFLEPEVGTLLLLEVMAAVLFLGFLGSAYPAFKASRQDPIRALRYE